jgi:hypothetical protein
MAYSSFVVKSFTNCRITNFFVGLAEICILSVLCLTENLRYSQTLINNAEDMAKFVEEKMTRDEKKQEHTHKLEKKYAPTLDNYGQSCFVRSDFF